MRNRLLIPVFSAAFLFSSVILSRTGTAQNGTISKQIPTPIDSEIALDSDVSITFLSLSPSVLPTNSPTPTQEPSTVPTVPVAFVPRIGNTTQEGNQVQVEVSTDPSEYQGSCKDPLEFTFTASITVEKPSTVMYRWLRSDGVETSTPQSVTFSAPGTKTVSTSWKPDFENLEFTGWQKMKILSPVELESNQASFSILCSL